MKSDWHYSVKQWLTLIVIQYLGENQFGRTHQNESCSNAVIIELANDIREEIGFLAGVYEISSDVNGKPSYRCGIKEINPYYISPYETGLFWAKIT